MFKVLKNEFNRLIKMPLMFLMFFVLLVAIFLSLMLFSPIQKPKNNLDFEDAPSSLIYSTFILENQYKPAYDNKITQAQILLNYYSKLHDRNESASHCLNNSLNAFTKLKSELSSGDSEVLYEKYLEFIQSVMEFKLALVNFSEMDSIDYIDFIATSPEYLNNLVELDLLLEKANEYDATFSNKTEAANALVNFFEVNLFEEKLVNFNKSVNKFLEITLNTIVNDVEIDYKTYTEYLKTSEAFFNTNYANIWRVSLLNKINKFSELFYSIVNSPYLTIYTANNLILNLDSSIINAQMAINLIGAQVDSYSAHKLAVEKIKNTNFINYLKDFSVGYQLIQPSKNAIENIQLILNSQIQASVDILYDNIVTFQNNSNAQLIINEIENYRELSNMAYDLVLYTAILDTHQELTNFKVNECFGEVLENFNEYEYQSAATLYHYLLTNNDFTTNYARINQFNTIEDSPTAIDYAFFALRVAAMIIVAILAVVATIIYPLDTKRGTMNLLLVRPLSRTQIFFGKFLAALLLGIVLFIFSFAFVLAYLAFANINYFSYTIISVFNATTIVKIQPIIALLIYSVSLIFEIAFLLAIIFLVAVSFKKSRLSFVVSGIILSLFYLFNLITNSHIAFAFFPHTNINFYKYFLIDSSFERQQLLFKLLHSPVVTNMNIWLSLIVYAVYISILFVISNAILKTRDY